MKDNNTIYDIAIIGGGINGIGIARDAAGRGLKTYLCDKGDLGAATSCSSSKMIHGGLRYLEFYEFGLVRKALKERDNLINIAPNLVKEQSFIIPHANHLRPKWLIRLGLFLYDNLYQSKYLQKSSGVSLKNSPLKNNYRYGFKYYDCIVNDHRLVIANALDAQSNGACINPYTSCEYAKITENGLWQVTVKNKNGAEQIITAKTLVNAAGPWVESFIKNGINIKPCKKLRLVKGSHIVTKKLYDSNQAYTFQDSKGRVVFTFPFEKKYTLIGTTEEDFSGNPNDASISDNERNYLCKLMASYFNINLTKEDIVWDYSGVRPLINEGDKNASQITRDYEIELLTDKAPLINIWGGKLTTYRVLAEDVLAKLAPSIGDLPSWSAKTPLITAHTSKQEDNDLQDKYHWLPASVMTRYINSYGKNCKLILNDCTELKHLGEHFGAGLYAKEVDYLIKEEWAIDAEAILWRRTKLGLHSVDHKKLSKYVATKGIL